MSEADPPRDKVGYRSPPKEHQFKKGVSGNPAGRPKRAKPSIQRTDLGSRLADQILMEEAYREVTIREGDEYIRLPVIRAVYRQMSLQALKGNRSAQKALADLVRQIEQREQTFKREFFETLVETKLDGEKYIASYTERGLEPPELVPHPDDIIIDVRKGTAAIHGPITPEEKKEWDRVLEHRDSLQENVSYLAKTYQRTRKPETKAQWLKGWMRTQRRFNRINDNLPKRYRKLLKDVCWEEGASRPGSEAKPAWDEE